jgi:hypothetical protein
MSIAAFFDIHGVELSTGPRSAPESWKIAVRVT